jgi:cytochrome c biogenesis protein CcmG/thiol:disulfide interchange protein DsbE
MKQIPLLIFLLLAGFFAVVLFKGKDPALVESAMIGKPVPVFDLPPAIKGKKGFASRDLQGTPSIVNVFASWCVMCQLEQGILEEIGRAEHVPVYGLNYKDTPEKTAAWLKKYGDPYTAVGDDRKGRVATDWGVYGVPETFVVDARGFIRYKHIGAVTDGAYQKIFKPLLAELRK